MLHLSITVNSESLELFLLYANRSMYIFSAFVKDLQKTGSGCQNEFTKGKPLQIQLKLMEDMSVRGFHYFCIRYRVNLTLREPKQEHCF